MSVSSSATVSSVTVGPIEGSQKQYLTVPGTDGDLHVPFRRISLTNGDHHDVYDTSGPYTQYTATDQLHDLAEGLPKTRAGWGKPSPVDGASTQLAWARAGIITDEMRFVAAHEGFDPEKVRAEVAAGRAAPGRAPGWGFPSRTHPAGCADGVCCQCLRALASLRERHRLTNYSLSSPRSGDPEVFE